MRTSTQIRKDVVHPELSFDIMGVLFHVQKELGYGHKERYYENAVAVGLTKKGLAFERQLRTPLIFEGKEIGYYIFDFLIEGKIILELKQGALFTKKNIDQVLAYLEATHL